MPPIEKTWKQKTTENDSNNPTYRERLVLSSEDKKELVDEQGPAFFGKGMRKIKSYNNGASIAVTSLGDEKTQNDANSVQVVNFTSPAPIADFLSQIKSISNSQNVTGIICIQVEDRLYFTHVGSLGKGCPRAHIVSNTTISEISNSQENIVPQKYSFGDTLILCSQGVPDDAIRQLQKPVKVAEINSPVLGSNTIVVGEVLPSESQPSEINEVSAFKQDPMVIATALEDRATNVATRGSKNITVQVTRLETLPPDTIRVCAVFDGENPGEAKKIKTDLDLIITNLNAFKFTNTNAPVMQSIDHKINQIKLAYPNADLALLNKIANHVKNGTADSAKCFNLLNQVEKDYGDLGKTLKYLVIGVALTAAITGIILGGWAPLGIIGALSLAEQVLVGFTALCITAGSKIYYEEKKYKLTTHFDTQMENLKPKEAKTTDNNSVLFPKDNKPASRQGD